MNDPTSYAKANGATRHDFCKFSEEFIDEIGKMAGRCIDIGSGPGDVAVDFILPKLNSKASFVCSDISADMVSFGEKKYKDNERVSFIKLDIESSNLPNDLIEEFDNLTSSYCLHWCKNMRQAFENIYNLLRPGGTAFLIFLADAPIFDAYESLSAMAEYQPYMKDVDRYIPIFQHDKQQLKTLRASLEAVGFHINHCSYREIIQIFKTTEDLSELLTSLNPFIERMPADLKAEYRKDLLKEVVKDYNISNKDDDNINEYRIPYHPFVVYITKPEAER